ncbi:MAG TPA: DUF2059 domain-containing protein [Caulobacteraceae bacterium]|nr:DUF2059 domain-containing protein [Caulobacteraceae bacterium]
MRRSFTDSEPRALVDFYGGPVGQSILEKSTAMAPRTAAAMAQFQPGMVKLMAEDLCKRINCAAAPTQSPRPS